MKKVLIITYYWPPAGGPGVQRVLKFAKYLPEFGWQPIILTVEKGEYPAIDETLSEEIPDRCKVYKTNSIEPTFLYKKFTGMKPDERIPVAVLAERNQNWKKRIANWIRLNLFVPDAKIGWIPFAVKAGKRIIEREKPDIIFSSSPPPTVHLIAMKLAKRSGIKWVADFRDPWTRIYHYNRSKKSKCSLLLDEKFEQQVVKSADSLVTVSNAIANLLKHSSQNKFTIIPNGYDEADFLGLNTHQRFDKFTLAYAGKMNNQQNPSGLWTALQQLIASSDDFANNFQMLFMGNIESGVIEEIKKHKIGDYSRFVGYIEHNQVIENILKSDVLLLLIPNTQDNEGIVTGKIFEYLATGNFILGIGPENGEAARILEKTKAGKMFDFSEFDGIKKEIEKQYEDWKNGVKPEVNKHEIEKYSRRELTYKLVEIFNSLI